MAGAGLTGPTAEMDRSSASAEGRCVGSGLISFLSRPCSRKQRDRRAGVYICVFAGRGGWGGEGPLNRTDRRTAAAAAIRATPVGGNGQKG